MRRVTPVKGWASHRAAYRAPEQAPRASVAHPDVTPRARVPCAVCNTTALQRAHRPRASPHRSSRARAALRAAWFGGAPRPPSRRPACGNESGSFAACRRARCVLQVAPPPSPPCQAQRCAFSARKRVVGRGRDGLRLVPTWLASTRRRSLDDTRRWLLAPAAGDSTPGAGAASRGACSSASASRSGDKGWLPRHAVA
jgi:hypothetical protein